MNLYSINIQKFNNWVINLIRFQFVLILTIVLIIEASLFHLILNFIGDKDIIFFTLRNDNTSVVLQIISMLLLAPIIETFLFQYLLYTLLNKIRYLNERRYLLILIGAIIFGISHCYSLFYIFYAFLLGIVLLYAYGVRIKSDNKTFYLIALCHANLNLFIILMNNIN